MCRHLPLLLFQIMATWFLLLLAGKQEVIGTQILSLVVASLVSCANGKRVLAAGGSVQGSRQLPTTAQCWGWVSAVGCSSQLVLHFTVLHHYRPPICASDHRKLGRITYFYTLVLYLQLSWDRKKVSSNCVLVLEYRSLPLCPLRQVDQKGT